MRILHNATRYFTEDLDQLIKQLLQSNARLSTRVEKCDFVFIESTPPPGSFFHGILPTYEKPELKDTTTFPYAANFPSVSRVIELAAPETWVTPLQCLAAASETNSACLPRDGIRLLAYTIQENWHHRPIDINLTSPVRAFLEAPVPDREMADVIIERLRQIRTRSQIVSLVKNIESSVQFVQKAKQNLTVPQKYRDNNELEAVLSYLEALPDTVSLNEMQNKINAVSDQMKRLVQ